MNRKYNLVDTPDKLRALDEILMDGDKPRYDLLAYDTETNGLDLYKTTVVGFSVSFNKHQGFYVPILKWVPEEDSRRDRSVDKIKYSACMEGKLQCVWTGKFFDEFVTPDVYDLKNRFPAIPFLIERWFGNTNLIMHNAPFDVNHTFINTGVDLKNQVFIDTSLLLHVLDENSPTGLKKAAERYRVQLGIDPYKAAAIEKNELADSVIKNGGWGNEVWRASMEFQYKYAAADTFLTFGIYEAAIEEFSQQFGDKGLNWFFKQEVMPVCKEVVIDMKRRGVYVDVPHFKKLFEENAVKLDSLEDAIMEDLAPHLVNFDLGKSIDETVSNQRFLRRIIQMEGLSVPSKTDKKTGEVRESLAKAEIKRVFEKSPHWIWGYILGEDELKYSEQKTAEIKKQLYTEEEGRRYRFNIGSRDHLKWLFCDKLGLRRDKLPQTESATKENPIPSMDADTLKDFMLPKFPWVARILTYKKLQKLQSNYIKPALELNISGWLYMDMKQNGTTSGRFSCSGGFNLQTLPRVDDEMELLQSCGKCLSEDVTIVQELSCMADCRCNKCGHVLYDVPRPSAIKQGFPAPPGFKIVNADFESLEPKIFAFMSGEDKIKEVYRKGLDLYSKIYCDIFDKEGKYSADPKAPNYLKKIAKAKRNWIKPVCLAIPYGSEDGQVANLIDAKTYKKDWKGNLVLDDEGNKILVPDIKEGKRVRDAYLNAYPYLRKYMNDQEEKAVLVGFVETLIGRRRHLPFAKKIVEVFDSYGINWRDLTEAPVWELKRGMNLNYTSFRGQRVSLTEEMIRKIQETIKFKDESLRERGYWAYIRSMLKSDLNNAKNNPIQGLAASVTNKGMLDTTRKFKISAPGAWVSMQVHDEICCYAPIEEAEKAAECLRDGMENNEFTALIDVAMKADPVICDNLKESK